MKFRLQEQLRLPDGVNSYLKKCIPIKNKRGHTFHMMQREALSGFQSIANCPTLLSVPPLVPGGMNGGTL